MLRFVVSLDYHLGQSKPLFEWKEDNLFYNYAETNLREKQLNFTSEMLSQISSPNSNLYLHVFLHPKQGQTPVHYLNLERKVISEILGFSFSLIKNWL